MVTGIGSYRRSDNQSSTDSTYNKDRELAWFCGQRLQRLKGYIKPQKYLSKRSNVWFFSTAPQAKFAQLFWVDVSSQQPFKTRRFTWFFLSRPCSASLLHSYFWTLSERFQYVKVVMYIWMRVGGPSSRWRTVDSSPAIGGSRWGATVHLLLYLRSDTDDLDMAVGNTREMAIQKDQFAVKPSNKLTYPAKLACNVNFYVLFNVLLVYMYSPIPFSTPKRKLRRTSQLPNQNKSYSTFTSYANTTMSYNTVRSVRHLYIRYGKTGSYLSTLIGYANNTISRAYKHECEALERSRSLTKVSNCSSCPCTFRRMLAKALVSDFELKDDCWFGW